jgi:hypothetical protein
MGNQDADAEVEVDSAQPPPSSERRSLAAHRKTQVSSSNMDWCWRLASWGWA